MMKVTIVCLRVCSSIKSGVRTAKRKQWMNNDKKPDNNQKKNKKISCQQLVTSVTLEQKISSPGRRTKSAVGSEPGNQYIMLCMGIDTVTGRLVIYETVTFQNFSSVFFFYQRLSAYFLFFRFIIILAILIFLPPTLTIFLYLIF